MKKFPRYISVVFLFAASLQTMAQLQYPASRKTGQTDDYFGNIVPDPYRWLENDNSEETKDWVKKQNAFTQSYLAGIPFKEKVYKRLEALQNYVRYGSPFIEDDWYYFYKNDGLQNQAVLYRQKDLKAAPELFLDPNKFSENGTTALDTVSFSKSAKYCAYSISKEGSDWNEAYIMDVSSKKLLGDKLEWIKFSTLSWRGDEGFYYSRYPQPGEQEKLSGQNKFHSVYYHKVGTSQNDDLLVYEDKEHPFRYHFANVTEDDHFLVLTVSEGTSGVQIMLKNLHGGRKAGFKTILEGFEHEAEVIDNDNKFLYLRTNVSAPNFRVVAANIANPFMNNWETYIPEKKETLEAVKTAGGKWFAFYLKDATSRVIQFTTGGYQLKELELPPLCSAIGYQGKRNDKDFFYSYASFTRPDTICRFNLRSEKSEVFKSGAVNFDPSEYETKQVFYTARDGVKIPLFLSYKKGLKMDGGNALLLYGYGGFNVSLTPSFSISNLFFMEQGGIYAQACLRGGAEYGEPWHKAGMLYNKQNVFYDFIAAAEYVVKEQYTNAGKIAIAGGSNGGLLVGACMVQRPALFKVVLPDVGVLDMLRFQKFTIGAGWVVEYGSSDDVEHFDNLYTYSPLHNLKPGTAYPATFISTGDHDDRVVPAHSFKFAARLQECQSGPNPVLIRIATEAGHGAGKSTTKKLEEMADKLTFTMQNLGMQMK